MALDVDGSEGANKAVGHVAPSCEAQKPSASTHLSPFLLSLTQSSSSIRCLALGTSAAAAIPIDDGADDDDEDDDNIKILVDRGNDDGDEAAAVNAEAHGSVNVGTPHPANAADSPGFSPFVLLDLNESAVADVKGRSCKKFLNNL